MAEKKRFPWGCLLGGCAIAVVGAIAVVVGVGYLGVQKARQIGEDLKDPEKRAEKVMDVLGAEILPEGLYPGVSFSVPFVMDMALLVDTPPEIDSEPGDFKDRGFIYFSVLTTGSARSELEDFFEGRANDAELLRQNDIELDLDQLLGRGTLEADGELLRWVAYKGFMDHHASDDPSLISMFQAECNDSRMRLGIWFRPASELPETAFEQASDEMAAFEAGLTEFAGHFRFCDS